MLFENLMVIVTVTLYASFSGDYLCPCIRWSLQGEDFNELLIAFNPLIRGLYCCIINLKSFATDSLIESLTVYSLITCQK